MTSGTKRSLALLSFVLGASRAVRAQPVGPEFLVTQATSGSQVDGVVGMSALGGFVVAWRDGSSGLVSFRRFDASGAALGPDTLVNSASFPAAQHHVSASATGSFVVVWSYSSGNSILGQRFDASGSKLGTQFTVFNGATTQTDQPHVASDANGDFVVVWRSYNSTTKVSDIEGRRFSNGGALLGDTFRVNASTTLVGGYPSISSSPGGSFVVAWEDVGDGSGYTVFARRFLPGGAPVGSPFQVNSSTFGSQEDPSVSMASDGSFVVVWDGNIAGIFGQKFDAAGITIGAEFRVNTYTSGIHLNPFVAEAGTGGFLVTWQGPDAASFGSLARFFDSTGHAVGAQFQLNTYTTNSQAPTGIATDGTGRFVVVWNSPGEDGSGSGVFGQRLVSPLRPITGEFQVNTYTTSAQSYAHVAQGPTGDFMVVWTSTNTSDLEARRYSSTGSPLTGEFRVNSVPGGVLFEESAVAVSSTGEAFVVWADTAQEGGGSSGVFARRFSADGTPLAADFRVNTFTTSTQQVPHVAYDGTGRAIVVWDSVGQDGSNDGVFGQRFDVSGAPLGGEFQVNTYTVGVQVPRGVAADDAGDFVIVWTGPGPDGAGIQARRFAASGAPSGSEFLVNTVTGGVTSGAAVTSDAAGNFVVAWASTGIDGDSYGIAARRFTSSGTPIGLQFNVNTYTTGGQLLPVISGDGSGSFAVIWRSFDADGQGIFGQLYRSTGEAFGTEFQVNTYTTSDQSRPTVSFGKTIVVAWESFNQDGSNTGVYARVFAPPCLPGDVNGDGKVDVADVFYLINSLFVGGPPPVCPANVDGDPFTNVADVFYLINFLFAGGPPPV